MKRILIKIMSILGSILIILSIGLIGRNYYIEYKAGKSLDKALAKLNAKIDEGDYVLDGDNETAVINIDNKVYMGIITAPSLGISIPIIKEYKYEYMNNSPCRYAGSYTTNDLIIAGHNYKKHLYHFKNMKHGEQIVFTTCNGINYYYIVTKIEVLNPNQMEILMGKKDNNWDLSIFTCSNTGRARYVIRCKKVDI